jgi:hypothetical protein
MWRDIGEVIVDELTGDEETRAWYAARRVPPTNIDA